MKWIALPIAAVLLFCISVYPDGLKRIPYCFDAGGDNDLKENNIYKLSKNRIYNSNDHFGWAEKISSDFERKQLLNNTLRNSFTYDGVQDTELEFKIDLPLGEWWITLWIEAGHEDTPTTELFLNQKKNDITWHKLKPDEEGAVKLSPIYRVVHFKYNLTGESLNFKLSNLKDSVRLLGFTLIPAVDLKSFSNKKLSNIINESGKYHSSVSLSDLSKHLKQLLTDDRENAYLFYWHQQISLLAEAERLKNMMGWEWAIEITGSSIFDRMHQSLMLLDACIENFDREDNFLLERALWYRGKICYDLHLERGGDYQKKIAEEDLSALLKLYPEENVLKMLNGQKVKVPDESDNLTVKGTPPIWACLQREVISRMKTEIDWWVNKRQASNGELGGKIDDDVEILRPWVSMLLFGDKNTITGWQKLADAVWKNSRVYKGFSKQIRDVEHSAEFISDSHPELLIVGNNNEIINRLAYTADYFENLWSEKNKFGHRYFKSAWLSSTAIDQTPPRDRDLDMNSRALKPLRYLAWATRNKRYIRLVNEWATAWLAASLRTDKGKPKGIVPGSMRGRDEALNGDEPNWYDANMLWDYYTWTSGSGTRILDHLIFTYTLTKNDSLLLPVELSLQLIKTECNKQPDIQTRELEKGSIAWTAQRLMVNQSFWSVVQKWRLLTQKNEYDEIISNYSTPYLKYLLTKNEKYLEEGLDSILSVLRFNRPLRTDLVVHTDRVRIQGIETLKAMLTGDATHEGNSPYFAVSWENTDQNIAALVYKADDNNLKIALYNFNNFSKEIIIRPWQLGNGNYKLSVNSGATIYTKKITVTQPGEKIAVVISPSEINNIEFVRVDL